VSDYISEFTALMASTPIKFASGRKKFVNDVISRNPCAAMFLRGRDISEVIQPGPKVKDRILLDAAQRFRSYFPGQSWNINNTQPGTNYEAPWAFNGSYMTWTEQEIELNKPGSMSDEGRMALYKDIKYQKEMEVLTDIVEGMDDALLAVPNAATMEAAAINESADRVIYSIFALVNEEANGLFINSATAAERFTSIYGLTPTDYTDREGNGNWQPKRLRYDAADLGDSVNGLISRMEEMTLELDYKVHSAIPTPLGDKGMLGDKTQWNRYAILTHLQGVKDYRAAKYTLGDQLVRRPDPSFRDEFGYSFFGIPIDWSPKIDSLPIFNSSSADGTDGAAGAGVTYDNAGNAGSRFWFFDTDHLRLFFHTNKMLEKRAPREPDKSVELWWQPIVCWWQLFPKSLRRHGVVYPGVGVT
jgi:hypothetical protein